MPDDFPLHAYNETHAKIASLQPRFVKEFRHYAGAWNAVAIRFRAAADADENFRGSVHQPPSILERYAQETALFGFFSNAVAVLDSLAYGLYAVGAMVNQHAFPLTEQALRGIRPKSLGTTLERWFPQEPLSEAVRDMSADLAYIEITEIRNALSHRTASTRTFDANSGQAQPLSGRWAIDHLQLKSDVRQTVDIDAGTTSRYRNFLSLALGKVLDAAKCFVHTNL